MKSTLGEMLVGAPAQLETAETQDEQELTKGELEVADTEAKTFQNRVQTALGLEVLASLGAVSYRHNSGSDAMRFQVNGRPFELRQAIGSVVNLWADRREIFQFNLSNPQAKGRFLEALDDALALTT